MSVPVSGSAVAAVALYELQDICRSVTGELHNLISSSAQCGVCFKIASDHIGDSVVGCLDRECSEVLLRSSIQAQIESARSALGQLRSVGRMSASLADIMQKSAQVAADRDTISKELSKSVSEAQALTSEVSDLTTDLDQMKAHSANLDAEVDDPTSKLSDAGLRKDERTKPTRSMV